MSIKTFSAVILSSLLIAGCANDMGPGGSEIASQPGISDYSDPPHVWWQ